MPVVFEATMIVNKQELLVDEIKLLLGVVLSIYKTGSQAIA